MRSIGHFVGGKEVKGTSGRTADVFEPMTGDVQAKVALASKAEVRAAVAQLERTEDRSFDSVAELLADLNAGIERDTGFAVLAWPRGASFRQKQHH